jgi:shikimate dehydrogenase
MSQPRYAVFGSPIAHSLSPRIHQAFARQTGIALDYQAIEADAGAFAGKLAEFAEAGGSGANITLPLKELAHALCVERSERAERCGAANTLIRTANGWRGDNTDGIGLVEDLTERHRIDLRGRRSLLLGAGGAARGVAPSLLDAGVGELFIVNRSADKADALADRLGQPGRVHTRYWDDLPKLGAFDFVLNATSAGRSQGALSLPFGLLMPRSLAVDLSYGDAAIPFLAWARAGKAEFAVDGLGMLVEQAAESFALWHGRRPDTDAIYGQLRGQSAGFTTGD